MIAAGTKIKALEGEAYYGIKEGDVLVVGKNPEFFEDDLSVWVDVTENPHIQWEEMWHKYGILCVCSMPEVFHLEWEIVE